jgi:hypothetical protein
VSWKLLFDFAYLLYIATARFEVASVAAAHHTTEAIEGEDPSSSSSHKLFCQAQGSLNLDTALRLFSEAQALDASNFACSFVLGKISHKLGRDTRFSLEFYQQAMHLVGWASKSRALAKPLLCYRLSVAAVWSQTRPASARGGGGLLPASFDHPFVVAQGAKLKLP